MLNKDTVLDWYNKKICLLQSTMSIMEAALYIISSNELFWSNYQETNLHWKISAADKQHTGL